LKSSLLSETRATTPPASGSTRRLQICARASSAKRPDRPPDVDGLPRQPRRDDPQPGRVQPGDPP